MSKLGINEGYHVLDDFVCEAVQAPDFPCATPDKQGRNEGMRVVQEIDLEIEELEKGCFDRLGGSARGWLQ